MKRTPLIFAALAPLVAVAYGDESMTKVNHQELRDDWRVSEVIGSDVRSSDGQDAGEVKDVILTDDGDIASILVSAGDLQSQESQKEVDTDQPAENIYTERGGGPATAGEEEGNADVVAVQWQNPTFNQEENVVELSASSSELQRLATATAVISGTAVDRQRRDGQPDIYSYDNSTAAGGARTGTTELDATGTGDVQSATKGTDTRTNSARAGSTEDSETTDRSERNIRASELLGMEVHLADEESYGEVDDVLISQDGEASAFIVDAGNFFQTEQYALPADASVDVQEGSVRYELTSDELENMEEFDLDENLQST